MSITRRRFLGYTAGVLAAGLPGVSLEVTRRGCVLLDLNEGGCFRESVSGFESVLTSAGAQWMRADALWMYPRGCAVLIVPVALKRPGGRGNLIFLGSLLGPALWAGDAQARRWLLDCLRTAGAERV